MRAQLVVSFNVTRLRFSLKAFKYEEDYVRAPKEKAKELLAKTANHPRITRAYGLHTNDMENIYVFYTIGTHLVLHGVQDSLFKSSIPSIRASRGLIDGGQPGLLFALSSPSVFYGKALLWTYTGARVLHSVFYLAGVQPWRAVSFLVHIAAQVLMLVHIGSTVLAHHCEVAK